MRIGLKLAPQLTTVEELRAVWRVADEAGFDHCWNFDHFASIGTHGNLGDVFEGWTLLAQFASSHELMFGDMGDLYYVLPSADLQAQRFDRAMGIMQCT